VKFKVQNSKLKIDKKFDVKNLIKALLENRGIKTKKEIEDFLNPKLASVTTESVGIDKKQLKIAIARIKKAIKNKEQIVVYGDYDVDGICATAILWETLNAMGAKVMPYIPHRIDEGYGLSETGIKNLKLKIKNCRLIITVDNGIVASKAVDFANKDGINVIITDHHVLPQKKPNAFGIIHTTELCGAAVACLLSQTLRRSSVRSFLPASATHLRDNDHLELVALATIADLVPLKGANRTFLKFGLEALRRTKRVGLLELFKEAGIDKSEIETYEIGHIIAPRINAMGRLEYAMESLRLLCTNNQKKAEKLAEKIGLTNKERQLLTIQTTEHAMESVKNKKTLAKLLIVIHESYEQGVIGLVASRLTEEFCRPAIVISKGKKFSKASARSIRGFNIIEFIKTAQKFLVDVGGHPMAAGFTVETEKLSFLKKNLERKAKKLLTEDLLTRKAKIDCEIPLSFINLNLYESLQKLAPFGIGNPEPTFLGRNIVIENMRLVGIESKHIKFYLGEETSNFKFNAIAFNMGEKADKLRIGDKINIIYTLNKDTWNGNERLQLKVKELQKN